MSNSKPPTTKQNQDLLGLVATMQRVQDAANEFGATCWAESFSILADGRTPAIRFRFRWAAYGQVFSRDVVLSADAIIDADYDIIGKLRMEFHDSTSQHMEKLRQEEIAKEKEREQN